MEQQNQNVGNISIKVNTEGLDQVIEKAETLNKLLADNERLKAETSHKNIAEMIYEVCEKGCQIVSKMSEELIIYDTASRESENLEAISGFLESLIAVKKHVPRNPNISLFGESK